MVSDSDALQSNCDAIRGARSWIDESSGATREEPSISRGSSTETHYILHVLRIWIMAGVGLSVAMTTGIQVYQLLGNYALTLIAFVAAFLTIFVGLVIALRDV